VRAWNSCIVHAPTWSASTPTCGERQCDLVLGVVLPSEQGGTCRAAHVGVGECLLELDAVRLFWWVVRGNTAIDGNKWYFVPLHPSLYGVV
jgi:hypothetical protein